MGAVSDAVRRPVPELIAVLRDGTVLERWTAARALLERPGETRVYGALTQALRDAERGVRAQAARSLVGLDPPREFLSAFALHWVLGEELRCGQAWAAPYLGRLGHVSTYPARYLLAGLSNPATQRESAMALGRMGGPAAREALPVLVAALRQPSSLARNGPGDTLVAMSRQSFHVVHEAITAAEADQRNDAMFRARLRLVRHALEVRKRVRAAGREAMDCIRTRSRRGKR